MVDICVTHPKDTPMTSPSLVIHQGTYGKADGMIYQTDTATLLAVLRGENEKERTILMAYLEGKTLGEIKKMA
jgi:hypothetical protein